MPGSYTPTAWTVRAACLQAPRQIPWWPRASAVKEAVGGSTNATSSTFIDINPDAALDDFRHLVNRFLLLVIAFRLFPDDADAFPGIAGGIGEQVFIDPGEGFPVHPQFGFPDFKTDGGFYALPSSRFLTTISTGTGNADSASAPGRLPGMGTDVPYAGRR